MKSISKALRIPAIISSALVLPFMILEWVNRHTYNEGYPYILFVILWLLQAGFSLFLLSIVREVKSGVRAIESPFRLSLRIVSIILIAWLWGSIILDQLPCFLGVPNCD